MKKIKSMLNLETIPGIIGILIITVIGCVYIGGAYYTVLAADDFSHALYIEAMHVDFWSYLKASFSYAYEMYMTWQGTYFSMFIQALFSPINNYGLPQLRVVMVLNAVFFMGGFWAFYWSVFHILMKEKTGIKLFGIAVFTFALFGYRSYYEVFFWFSGATSYGVPISCLLMSLAIYLNYLTQKKKSLLVGAGFLGILAMGGSLTIAGTGCYLLLLIVLAEFLEKNRVTVSTIILFCLYLAGALVNTLAPGNYTRHGVIDDGIYPMKAFRMAWYQYEKEVNWLFDSTNMMLLMAIIMLCGFFLSSLCKVKMKNHIIISLFSLVLPLVTAFPVTLAYSKDVYYPDRCLFILDLAVELVLFNLAFVIGRLIAMAVSKMKSGYRKIAVVLLFVVLLCTTRYKNADVVCLDLAKNLLNGTIPSYYEECERIVDTIENSQEANIVITNMPTPVPNFGEFLLLEEPHLWPNSAIALLYGKESVCMKNNGGE